MLSPIAAWRNLRNAAVGINFGGRDGGARIEVAANSYFTCQMYMNGGLDERQLLEMQFQTLKIVEPLISTEIKLMYQKNGENDEVRKTSATSKSSDAIKLDVTKTVTDILKEKSAKPTEAPQPEPTE